MKGIIERERRRIVSVAMSDGGSPRVLVRPPPLLSPSSPFYPALALGADPLSPSTRREKDTPALRDIDEALEALDSNGPGAGEAASLLKQSLLHGVNGSRNPPGGHANCAFTRPLPSFSSVRSPPFLPPHTRRRTLTPLVPARPDARRRDVPPLLACKA